MPVVNRDTDQFRCEPFFDSYRVALKGRPAGLTIVRWRQFAMDVDQFFLGPRKSEGWNTAAHRLGWTAEELFGPPGCPEAGAIWRLEGRSIVAVTARSIVVHAGCRPNCGVVAKPCIGGMS